jgi:hypothetical protein
MTPLAYDNDQRYAGFATSGEILKAIEEIAGDDILDDSSNAYKMWRAPTKPEDIEIEKLAWSYATEEIDLLYWGGSVAYKR